MVLKVPVLREIMHEPARGRSEFRAGACHRLHLHHRRFIIVDRNLVEDFDLCVG